MFVGGGCEKQLIQQKSASDQAIAMATYSNTLGGYSFSYPKSLQLGAVNSAVSENIAVYNVPSGTDLPDNAFPALEFKIIKTTVYPESKIEVLKKEYFKDRKTKVAPLKINDMSGWVITQTESIDEFFPYARVLYFPKGSGELLVFDFNNDEITEQIINSLKTVK